MCLNPLTIKSNKSIFNPECDPLFYQVPCGKCKECLSNKQSEWNVRAYYEYKACIDKGGFVLFVTLTYNEDNLPYVDLYDYQNNYLDTLPCFNKVDIQHFLHRLRKRLSRKVNHTVNLKYLITSEYGGTTHRPHYHGLIFIYDNLYPDYVKKEINDCWPHGFTSFGQNGGKVYNHNAIRYVTKYITKDFTFLQIEKLQKEIALLPESVKAFKRNCCPFHLQSKGFGLAMLDYVSKEELVNGKTTITTDIGPLVVSVPLYIDRKLLYKVVNGSYVLTDYGKQIKMLRYPDMMQHKIQQLETHHKNINAYETLTQEFTTLTLRYLPTKYKRILAYYGSIQKVFDAFFEQVSYTQFIDYLVNKRHYLYISDLHTFPNPSRVIYDHDYVTHLKLSTDDREYLLATYGKYATVTDSSADFNKAKDYLISNVHEYEEFAKLYDCTLFASGVLKHRAWMETLQEQEKAKQVKKQLIYDNKLPT